jgi:septal ring factor EnvC (AmiA/AmiB activator)
MAKTRKQRSVTNGGDKKSGCMDTKCKLMLEETEKNMKKLKIDLEKKLQPLKKKETTVCNKSSASNRSVSNKSKETPTECEKIKEDIKWVQGFLDKLEESKKSGESDKKLLDNCEKYFCNEGCKNTIFEDGAPDKLSKGFSKLFKNNKEVIKMMEKSRKELFGNKTSVLKDGFFEGLKPKSLKKLKKEGAISGCVRTI